MWNTPNYLSLLPSQNALHYVSRTQAGTLAQAGYAPTQTQAQWFQKMAQTQGQKHTG